MAARIPVVLPTYYSTKTATVLATITNTGGRRCASISARQIREAARRIGIIKGDHFKLEASGWTSDGFGGAYRFL